MDPRAQLLTVSFDLAHMVFNAVIGDMDDRLAAHRLDGGMVPSAGAMIAHAVFGEDMMVGQVSNTPLLIESQGFGQRTGMLQISPGMTPDWLAQDFRIDGLKDYAAAVFARTSSFLVAATAPELDKTVATPMGSQVSAADYLGSFAVLHLAMHTGEVSTLKGSQGAKGLPF